ncbi:MAG: hypothetical protein JSR42_19835 [Proteobacteria bacterium]|nr:hypothetical protein [Pseudomonadota bacterium]
MRRPSSLRNAPAALALDFGPRRRRPGWLGWLALLIGSIALVATLYGAWSDYADVDERARIVERLRAQTPAAAAQLAVAAGTRGRFDGGATQAVAARLNADWAGVFADVARAQGEGITLMELHGDAARGSLRIVADAPDLDVAFAWIERLQQADGALRNAALDSHAWIEGKGGAAVRINATASWGAAR